MHESEFVARYRCRILLRSEHQLLQLRSAMFSLACSVPRYHVIDVARRCMPNCDAMPTRWRFDLSERCQYPWSMVTGCRPPAHPPAHPPSRADSDHGRAQTRDGARCRAETIGWSHVSRRALVPAFDRYRVRFSDYLDILIDIEV